MKRILSYGKMRNICPIKECHVQASENTHLHDFWWMVVKSVWQFSIQVKTEYFYKWEKLRDKSTSDRQNILEKRYPTFFNCPKQTHLENIWSEISFWFVDNFFIFQLTEDYPHSETKILSCFSLIQYPQKINHFLAF